jgi:signal peptidase I
VIQEKIWNPKMRKEFLSLGLMLLGIFSFRSSIAEPYVVPSGSMEPSILPGDYLFVSKLAYSLRVPFTDISLASFHEPKRGDIVVFRYPLDTSVNFVKRLIGLPGDDIVVTDGEIRINGQALKRVGDEEYLGEVVHPVQRLPHLPDPAPRHFIVPKDSYFFMGDNRDNSNDSRVWGFVPKAYIKGKAIFVWMSLNKEHTIPEVRWNRIGHSLF